MRHFLLMLRIAVFTVLAMPVTATSAAEAFSEANQLLFMSPHLDRLDRAGTAVNYRYDRSGTSADETFSDRIILQITSVAEDGARDVDVQFFSGERERYFPSVERARGNPVLVVFLQHDVTRMGQHTGAPVRYFQNRIKTALEEDAEVTATTIHYNGSDIPGKEIRITPYSNDPDKSRYDANYWEKRYIFTVSDEIPGFIYRIEAVAPGLERGTTLAMETAISGFEEDANPWQKDTLILERVDIP